MYFEDRKKNKYNQVNQYDKGNQDGQGMNGNQYNQGNQMGEGMNGNSYNQGNNMGGGMYGDQYDTDNVANPDNPINQGSLGGKYNPESQTNPGSQGNPYYPSTKHSMMSQGSTSKDIRKMHDECQKLMNYHSLFATKDGTKFDGIVLKVESDYVIILVAEDILSDSDDDVADEKTRQYGYGNPRRFRRFVPRRYLYNNIGRVGLLPYPYFVPPYPYIVPPYPIL